MQSVVTTERQPFMALTVIRRDGLVTVVTATGLLRFIDLVEFIHEEWASAKLPILFDVTAASAEHLSGSDVRQLATLALAANRRYLREDLAIVAPHDDEFGMAQAFQSLVLAGDRPNVGVFRSAAEATFWLLRLRDAPFV
jgi:hypothetical protein